MNITLPETLAKRLDRLANKSGFIARAVVERLLELEKTERRRALGQAYLEASSDPEYLKEEERLKKDWESADADGLEGAW